MNFKHIKPQLEQIKIIKKDTMLGGEKGYYYICDKEESIKILKEEFKLGEDTEILELDDDFEEEEYNFEDSDEE